MEKERLIRKYLHGELSIEEANEMELLVGNDAEFAAELEIQSVYYAERSTTLKSELITYRPQVKKSFINDHIPILLFVIGLLVLVFLLKKYYFDEQSNTAVHFAQQYLEQKHVAPTVLMGEQDDNELWAQSVALYNNASYKQAGISFLKTSSTSGKSDQALLYAALSYLYSDDNLEFMAKPIFKSLIEKQSVFKEEARWYLALMSIRVDDNVEAKKMLEEITFTKSWNYAKAQNILDRMKE